jgi:circadian clock protein KaiB
MPPLSRSSGRTGTAHLVERGRGAAGEGPMLLRLYVAGDSPASSAAISNLEGMTAALPAHVIEIVDVLDHPSRSLEDEILLAPTLIKVGPGSPCRIIGALGDASHVLGALGLTGRSA